MAHLIFDFNHHLIMNTLRILLCLAVASFSVACSNTDSTPKTNTNQPTAPAEVVSFKVLGNCEMCQERIIEAVKQAGVQNPRWTPETQTFVASLSGTNLTKVEVCDLIAASGHDTEFKASTDSAYQNLPDCCQYERTIKVKALAVYHPTNSQLMLTSILPNN